MAALLKRAWLGYDRLLRTHPLVAPALTTGGLMGAGDLAAQLLSGYNYRRMNLRRTARVFLLGTCIYGPFLNKWYYFISHKFAGQRYRVLKMVAADQLFLAPFTVAFYVSAVSVLSTGGTEEVAAQLEKFPEMMATNYKVWPAVQVLNFAFAPKHLRLLVVNCVTLLWNAYLSWMAHHPRTLQAYVQPASNTAGPAKAKPGK